MAKKRASKKSGLKRGKSAQSVEKKKAKKGVKPKGNAGVTRKPKAAKKPHTVSLAKKAKKAAKRRTKAQREGDKKRAEKMKRYWEKKHAEDARKREEQFKQQYRDYVRKLTPDQKLAFNWQMAGYLSKKFKTRFWDYSRPFCPVCGLVAGEDERCTHEQRPRQIHLTPFEERMAIIEANKIDGNGAGLILEKLHRAAEASDYEFQELAYEMAEAFEVDVREVYGLFHGSPTIEA
jgi:hypothetical protein